MAEAYGSIILNAGKLNEELKLCKVKLNWELIEKLLNMTSISYECNPNLARFDIRGSEFLFENKILINEKYNRFEIFGDEWMRLAKALVQDGSQIELYGLISDEYRVREYYALNSEGESFFGVLDDEVEYCSEIDEKTLKEKWLSIVPEIVRKMDEEVFSF